MEKEREIEIDTYEFERELGGKHDNLYFGFLLARLARDMVKDSSLPPLNW